MPYDYIYGNQLHQKLSHPPLDDSANWPEIVGKELDREFVEMKQTVQRLHKAKSTMAQGFEQVLQGLKQAFPQLDLQDPNFKGTPERMARAYLEVCGGLAVNDHEVFTTTFPADTYNEMVMLKDIEYTSLCSHHFFPFVGLAHVGYLPDPSIGKKSRVVGLSKLARVVDMYARRPQLQERMCIQIKNAIAENLRPSGVMVVLEGKHGCLTCRGARKQQSTMITSAVDGKFKDDPKLRSEFLDLLKMGK